ncbi:phosphodiester glycosidase family protein [Pontibacter anaerobius]|uniref:Phosphodiester glycosidase family protein n=1 Tax=Pontibacter anaerobius TaxID=2993940 RepID=A0ABT3RDK2_9BACT|nr:phosphodiester glycosidase family protein [Pontibacter anaerobius]MCX2739928.1 phosphodiester glycosidase family protein [Pontibacter anaerobius]
MNKRFTRLATAILILLAPAALSQKLTWEPREDLNILLPASIKIYETNGSLADGAPVRAMYATVDLRDENLKLRAIGDPSNRQTTLEHARDYSAILAINGGYFAPTKSVSLYFSDGELVEPGISKSAENYITRGAFGMVNGKPDIAWTSNPIGSLIYKYSQPNQPGEPAPTTKGGELWLPSQAVGGGPMLVKQGKIVDVGAWEGFGAGHLARNPRTAIGYPDEHTLLMLVVDGRQGASAGVTILELANIMQQLGCEDAVNLDGGGSSAMVAVNIPTDIPNGNRNSLRKNANALVLTEQVESPRRDIIYIDTDSEHYTEYGLWRNTNHASYYGSTRSRQALSESGLNGAKYEFKPLTKGKYQLATWWTVDTSSNAQQVPYVLHHGGKTDTLHVNQKSYATSGRWNVLGNFIFGPNDYLELLGQGNGKKVIADAVRLVAIEKYPELPRRGDLRLAVISDLNSGLGAATYEWQVDSIMQRIPRIWQPDLVVCGGDMVAGQGIAEAETLEKMWRGFKDHIATPLRKANIPFAFTLGNHDGSRHFTMERDAAGSYWSKPENLPNLQFIDKSNFPYFYSFLKDGAFFVSWEASSSEVTEENLAWMAGQFATPEARQAKYRFVLGHLPLYSVAQERDSKGNLLHNPEKLRHLLEKHNVHTYISGHQHAYYPGKRGKLELLNAGAAGTGPRSWLSLDKTPVNTITLVDIFYEQDTVIYTTYDIGKEAAQNMAVFDEKVLPQFIEGVNGYLIRRDVSITGKATGTFSPLHALSSQPSTGTGSAEAVVRGKKVYVKGEFNHLQGKVLKVQDAITLYRGRHTEQGEKVLPLKVKRRNGRKGSFKGSMDLPDGFEELLSVGAFYISIKTDRSPEGELRAQLYPTANLAPAAVAVSSHNIRNTYAVRDTEALFGLSWEKAIDPDGDFVSYTYQLATDEDFRNLVWHRSTGRVASIKLREQDWYGLLQDAAEGEAVTFYHRIITSDGKHATYGPAQAFRLMKSNEPLEDFVEVPAPKYKFNGKIAEGAGYGAKWDKYGKLWLASYNGTLEIQKPDGTDAPFSPLEKVSINGQEYNLKTIGGMGVDADGNILIARNRHLLKIDAATGKGIAAWEVPDGGRAITSPRVNDKGEIYAMSLFGEDLNYVLKQSEQNPHTFELIRTIELPERILSREFAMSPDGHTLYFPNSGSPYIQVYTSKDGIKYKQQESITSTSAGCNAIEVGPGNTLWTAVRASGVVPATFHCRDETSKKMWTLELPELNGAEARGLGISANGDTLIFCSWDKGGGFYKYVLQKEEGAAAIK